jgi:hypothetical protein
VNAPPSMGDGVSRISLYGAALLIVLVVPGSAAM